jgi:Flp pilus assembly protein TadD
MSLERYADALDVLEKLTHLVPKEAPVYIMIGKIHKKLGRKDLAL